MLDANLMDRFFSGLQKKPYKTKKSQRYNGFSAVAQGLHFNYEGGNAGTLPLAHFKALPNI